MAKPNIVLITVDCLRKDHLHFLTETLKIPHISFENVFSNAPFTAFSVPSFLTSKYPPLLHPRRTIASYLKEEGYETAAFVPNVMLIHPKVRKCKLQSHFDIYKSYLHSDPKGVLIRGIDRSLTEIIDFMSCNFIEKYNLNHVGALLNRLMGYYPFTKWITEEDISCLIRDAKNFLSSTSEPFFLWIHTMDVHEPYTPPDSFTSPDLLNQKKIVNRRLRYTRNWVSKEDVDKLHRLYINEIKYTDFHLSKFIDKILKNNTIVILSADHGEQFLEHGDVAHRNWNLHDEQIHVPFLIFGLKNNNYNTERFSSLVDLLPTILDIADMEVDNEGLMGKSVLSSPESKSIFLTGGSGLLRSWRGTDILDGVRTKNWKLFNDRGNWRLYDLKNDPNERVNIYDSRPEQAELLHHLIDIYKKNRNI